MKRKVTLLNMISCIVLQFATLVSGFVIPKIILSYFGSNVNGLVTSINQFLSYISLVEGGVTGVAMANLYKPLVEKNNDKLSKVVVATRSFYNKIAIIFAFYTIILALTFDVLFDVPFSYLYVLSLIIILSINLMLQYMFSLTFKTLLNADKKIYIVNFTQSVIIFVNIVMSIICVHFFVNIHILKLISSLLYIIQPIVFFIHIQKHYEIDWKAPIDGIMLKERWDGFAINVAAFIHNCTDITILTYFTSLGTVSVYSVYALVTSGLKGLIASVSSVFKPNVGHALAKGDSERINFILDCYEYIILLLVGFFFTIAGLLITSFVMIYTRNLSDANYYQPIFGWLIVIAEALYLVRYPHLSVAYSAGRFKELSKPAYTEAFINIFVSLILVSDFGIVGVAIGTICAMFYRLIFQVYFTTKIIENRSQIQFYRKILLFLTFSICSAFTSQKIIVVTNYDVLEWIIVAVLYSCIVGIAYILLSILFFKKEFSSLLSYILKK